MNNSALLSVFIFLVATCLMVPLASRFRLGSVLGYLVAGIIIGPFGIGLIRDGAQVSNLAEFGVIMMLFLIGLELDPLKLWKMRKAILGLGGLQVILTSLAFMGLGLLLHFSWELSLAAGMSLAMSSTAIVLQMLQEKGLLQTSAGQSAFAVLLLQDIAVIPILIIMPLLAVTHLPMATTATGYSTLPAWVHAVVIFLVIALVILAGKYLSRHLFHFIAKSHLREVFTATSLALVVGITLLMKSIGVSPALGAFIGGLVLANSEYKHTVETDIQPFKGLFLGLFFVSIGMGMNFGLFIQYPLSIILAVIALILIKLIILLVLGRWFNLGRYQTTIFAVALAQGGEFAFVLFQYASGLHVMTSPYAEFLTLVVALSMALTPFLMMMNEKLILPRFMSRLPLKKFDEISEKHPAIIVAGYGRFGQIVGRFARAQGLDVTLLEIDPDQIDLLRRFGIKVYFGDASNLELLRSAGLQQAKIFVVAIDDPAKALEIVKLVHHEFPHIKIFARARNRRYAGELLHAGAYYIRRETFDSSLTMAQAVMNAVGYDEHLTHRKAQQFREHDEALLKKSVEYIGREEEFVDIAKQAGEELKQLLTDDLKGTGLPLK
jgi:glutathione-regulated potassium-efflux system ancillary protein KefC